MLEKDKLLQDIAADTDGLLLVEGAPYKGKDADFARTFTDNFSDTAGPWVQGNNEYHDARIADGHYYFKHKITDKGYYSFVPMSIQADTNWAIETKIETLQLPENNSFGLVFGKATDGLAGSVFVVNTHNKTFQIMDHNDKKWFVGFDKRFCFMIQPDINTLRVENLNGYWQFFINNFLVWICPTQALYGTGFGFAFNGDCTMRADYFKVQW